MVAGVGDDSLRPANPYKHWPEPHFKRILNKTKRKSPGKTLQSREFQRVPRSFLPLTCHLKQQNTCRNRGIERIATSVHRNADHKIGSLKQLLRESVLLAADYESGGKPVCKRSVIHQPRRRRSDNRYTVGFGPAIKFLYVAPHQLLGKERSHGSPYRCWIVGIAVWVEDKDSAHPGRLSGSDDCAQVSR